MNRPSFIVPSGRIVHSVWPLPESFLIIPAHISNRPVVEAMPIAVNVLVVRQPLKLLGIGRHRPEGLCVHAWERRFDRDADPTGQPGQTRLEDTHRRSFQGIHTSSRSRSEGSKSSDVASRFQTQIPSFGFHRSRWADLSFLLPPGEWSRNQSVWVPLASTHPARSTADCRGTPPVSSGPSSPMCTGTCWGCTP